MDTEIKKRFPRLRKYGLPALLAVVLISAGTGAWLSTRVSTYHTDFNKLVTDKVFAGEFNDYINLTGKVETDIIVKVSASETGIVESISVEEGAMVHEGDIILTLRNPLLRQQILDSESQLAEKQNMLRDTEITMEKERLQVRRDILSAKTEVSRKRRAAEQQKTLFEEGLTSREEYLKAREEYDLARENLRLLEERLHQDSIYRTVQVAMMKENLRNMEENFQLVCQRGDNLNVRASHTGQLGSLNADIGQNISVGEQVGQINILDNYKLTVSIDEHYVDRITCGLQGKITRNGRTYHVRIKKIYPDISEGKFRANLIFESPLPDNLRIGQTYPIDLFLGDSNEAVMLAKGTFFQSSGGKYVYVVSADGKTAQKREIRIGRRNPDYYEILDGLTAGEEVITSSYQDFGEADRIEISR